MHRPTGWDTDHEGMPDNWEKQAGLDPNNPHDANEVPGEHGYTNLERYLGWLVGEFLDPGGRGNRASAQRASGTPQ